MTDYMEKAREIAWPYRKPGKDHEYGVHINRIVTALREAHEAGRQEGIERAADIARSCEITVPLGVGVADGASMAASQIAAAILSDMEARHD